MSTLALSSHYRKPWRAARVASLALLVAGTLSCSREKAPASATLALSAPLPENFPRSTQLVIGDPTIKKQLELTGGLDALPFTAAWHNISGGPTTIEAFRAGALDGGSVGDTPPIHARFTGLDIRIIAVQVRSKPAMRFATAPGSGLQTLEQLRGKRIAYSPGQAQGALVLRALKKLGLKKSDVSLIELTSSEFKDALGSRQVDMAPLSGPTLKRYLNEYGKEGALALEHGVRDTLSFFYVRRAVLEDPHKAAALREYVKTRTHAQLWSFHHPEEWIAGYYVKDQGLSPEDARYLVDAIGEPQYPDDWSEAIALTQETIDLLSEASGKPRFDASELFDRRFEKVAAEAASKFTGREARR